MARMTFALRVGTAILACAVVAALAVARPWAAQDDVLLDRFGGAPPYEWNQPFLDWPQSGDLPCEQEFGPCGPALPTLDAATKALGQPLRIADLKVDVGKPGRHEVEIGRLVLPNGIHSRTYFRIVNGDTTLYRVAQTHVEFRSLLPGAPPFAEFARDRPAVKGPEPVAAVLVWDVDWAAEGAIMEIADLEIK